MTKTPCHESSTALRATSQSAKWLRMMALLYDPFVWLGEIAGMRRRRRTLLADVRGRVVEIGAGTGLNIAPLFRRGRRTRAHGARARDASETRVGASSGMTARP